MNTSSSALRDTSSYILPITILRTPSLLIVTFRSCSMSMRVEAKIGCGFCIPSSNIVLLLLEQVFSLFYFVFCISISLSNIRSRTSFESLFMTLVSFWRWSSVPIVIPTFARVSEWNRFRDGTFIASYWPYFSAVHYYKLSEVASKFKLLYYMLFAGCWTVTLVRFDSRSRRRWPRVFFILY